ncbi:hypothetical protein [Salinivirga cyanobacteriivorans]
MKKLLLTSVVIIFSMSLFGQKIIDYKQWSNPKAFQTSPTPVITGFGAYSDSLSNVYDGKTFFANGTDYFQIESWADYYYWFTQKYWYKFKHPELYEYFYLTENDYEMARYVATQYLGKYYPSAITIQLGQDDKKNTTNRTAGGGHYANNMKKVQELQKDLRDPINKVKVRTFNYDINEGKVNAKREATKQRYDYSHPNNSGIRTFKHKTAPAKINSKRINQSKSRSTRSSGSSNAKRTKSKPSKSRER